MFQNFISIVLWFTLSKYLQKIHFPQICFDRRLEIMFCSDLCKVSDAKPARSKQLQSCFSVLSLWASLTSSSCFSPYEHWDTLSSSLTDSWIISFIIKK